jgi:hypothetical protein
MLVPKQTLLGGFSVFSVLLELPEYEVVNLGTLSTYKLFVLIEFNYSDCCYSCGYKLHLKKFTVYPRLKCSLLRDFVSIFNR